MGPYICELLFDHNCVIIPGFGGIVANVRRAECNKFSEEILPPRKQIAFNSSLTSNDGLLISHIAKVEGCSYAVAEGQVLSYVVAIKKELADTNQAELAGIGMFRRDFRDKIHFYPESQETFDLESFGLVKLHARAIPEPEVTVLPVAAADNEGIEVHVPEEEERSPDIPIYSPWYFRIAAMLSGVFLLTTILLNVNRHNPGMEKSGMFFKGAAELIEGENLEGGNGVVDLALLVEKEYHLYEERQAVQTEEIESDPEESRSDIAETVSLMDADPGPENQEGSISETTEGNAQAMPDGQEDQSLSPSSSGAFVFIVGSFKSSRNAAHLLHTLERKGYQADTLDGPNGFTRVGVKFQLLNSQVDFALEKVRSDVTKEAWLLED